MRQNLTEIHCWIFGYCICSTKSLSLVLHQNNDRCQEAASDVKLNKICQKWCESNVDSKRFQRTLRFEIPNTFSYQQHQNILLFNIFPHDKLKTKLFDIIDSCFFLKKKRRKYSYIVVSHYKTNFVRHHSDSTHKYSEVDIKATLEILNNIIVVFGIRSSNSLLEFPWT